jgi:uncharacterized delta-60 repeat protein
MAVALGSGLMLFLSASPAQAAAGDLDTSWDGDGIARADFGPEYSFADGVTTKDGTTVAVGGWSDGTSGDFAIAQFKKDGTLDPKFGGDGLVTQDFFGTYDLATSVAFQGEKIVVAGYSEIADPDFQFAIAQFKKDGSLDTSFSGDGLAVQDFGPDYDAANAVAVKGDRILAGGPVTVGGDLDFGLAQWRKDGTLDSSFGGDGLVTTELGGRDSIGGLIWSGDRIVASGYSNAQGTYDFALAQYKKDGALDTSFGGDGVVLTDFAGGDDFGASADLDGNRIVLGGWATLADEDFAAARYEKNGDLDTSFSGDGRATIDLLGYDEAVGGALVGPGREVVLGGTSYDDPPDSTRDGQFAVAQLTKTGAPDTSFGGGDGWTKHSVGSGPYEGAYAMAFTPDHRIVLAGEGDDQFVVTRYLNK